LKQTTLVLRLLFYSNETQFRQVRNAIYFTEVTQWRKNTRLRLNIACLETMQHAPSVWRMIF